MAKIVLVGLLMKKIFKIFDVRRTENMKELKRDRCCRNIMKFLRKTLRRKGRSQEDRQILDIK